MPDTRDPRSVIEAAEQAAAAGDYASAERLLREAADLQEASLGPLHPDLPTRSTTSASSARSRTSRTMPSGAFGARTRSRPRPRARSSLHRHESKEPRGILRRQGKAGRRLRLPAPATGSGGALRRGPARGCAAGRARSESATVPNLSPQSSRTTTDGCRRTTASSPAARSRGTTVPRCPDGRARRWRLVVIAAGDDDVVPIGESILIVRRNTQRDTPGPRVKARRTEARRAKARRAQARRTQGRGAGTGRTQASRAGEKLRPAPSRPAGAPRTKAAPVVVDVQLCRDLRTGGPVASGWRCDPATSPVAPGRLLFYTRLKSPTATTVQHRWYRGDRLRQSVDLTIRPNPGSGYRTYSRNTVSESGEWRVELRTRDGVLLHEERFTVRIERIRLQPRQRAAVDWRAFPRLIRFANSR